MDQWIIIVIAIYASLSILGLIAIIQNIIGIRQEVQFIQDYGNKFDQLVKNYFQAHKIDSEMYYWLTKNVNKAQRLLNYNGKMLFYRPAYQNVMYEEYPILLNTLPKFPRDHVDSHDINMCFDALTRHLGDLEEQAEYLSGRILNPLAWLQDGFRLITLFPLFLLEWLGLLESSLVRSIIRSPLFRLVSGLTSIIAFLATVIGFIVDWQDFIHLVQRWF